MQQGNGGGPPAKKDEKDSNFIEDFMGANDILVVDPVSSARVSLTGTLVQMGAKRNRMSLVGTLEEARAVIQRLKPKVIFCEYMVGKESGLDLIQEQKLAYGNQAKDCFFVLVTSNGSQSAVARAAEEDVDTFVIKPYTIKTFRHSLNEALKGKLDPSDYARTIEQGKTYLKEGANAEAELQFKQAQKQSATPTLACFYLGQTALIKEALAEATDDYRQGLSYNKIHYKCLIGLFDLQMKQNKHTEAYDVVKKIAQYFPANPKRLASVLRLAIMTKNYDDIEGYYRIFTQLDVRSDELTRYICSALSVTAKHYLTRSTRSRAIELFDKVAISCAGRIQFMRYAVETMVAFDCQKDALDYMKKFPPELRGKPDYLIASLTAEGATRPSGEMIQKARDIIAKDIEEPCVYLVLIYHLGKGGLKDAAEHTASEASKKWPKQAEEFSKALEDGNAACPVPKKAKAA
jgi:DNA-binding NarL/FixJ family response regulator